MNSELYPMQTIPMNPCSTFTPVLAPLKFELVTSQLALILTSAPCGRGASTSLKDKPNDQSSTAKETLEPSVICLPLFLSLTLSISLFPSPSSSSHLLGQSPHPAAFSSSGYQRPHTLLPGLGYSACLTNLKLQNGDIRSLECSSLVEHVEGPEINAQSYTWTGVMDQKLVALCPELDTMNTMNCSGCSGC